MSADVDRIRIRIGIVLLVVYLGFALWSSIDPSIKVPAALPVGVGAFLTWLFLPALPGRGRRR